MKQLLLATTVLLATTMAGNAVIIQDLGINPTSAQGDFSNSVGGLAFSDQYTFQLVGGPQFTAFASATNVFTQPSDLITNFTGQLFNSGPNGVPGGGDDVAVNPAVLAVPCPTDPTGCQVLAGSAILNAGNYFLNLAGTGGGTSGYGGNLTTTPVAVPGPLAGSGLPGLLIAMAGLWGLAKRRRNKV